MTRDAFQQIRSHLHFVDNATLKKRGERGFSVIGKVAGVLNVIQERLQRGWTLREKVSHAIDLYNRCMALRDRHAREIPEEDALEWLLDKAKNDEETNENEMHEQCPLVGPDDSNKGSRFGDSNEGVPAEGGWLTVLQSAGRWLSGESTIDQNQVNDE